MVLLTNSRVSVPCDIASASSRLFADRVLNVNRCCRGIVRWYKAVQLTRFVLGCDEDWQGQGKERQGRRDQ